MLETNLKWNDKRKRLEGTLLGIENAERGRAYAYQGELINGEIVTVYWTGIIGSDHQPELRCVDNPKRQISADESVWKWFERLVEMPSLRQRSARMADEEDAVADLAWEPDDVGRDAENLEDFRED